MGKVFDGIDPKLATFLTAQPIFFVASAPSGEGGHVNLSPKGYDSFRILKPHTVAYLDFVGSGVETIAHLRQNGRLTLMFCAFEGPPRIVRLYGRGKVVGPSDDEFGTLSSHFGAGDGIRSVIVATLDRVADSCGYGVPLMAYQGQRPQMKAWFDHKGPAGLENYLAEHHLSVDGLPGLTPDRG